MKFLSIDQHISVIADIRYIFNQLGHQVDERSISGHASIIGRPVSNFPMLMNENWRKIIKEDKTRLFHQVYKDEFEKYDGFICCYPPIFSMLYEYFNKPIIIQIPIRYECGADDDPVLWERFNNYLQKGIDEGRIFINANSIYDQKYTECFINRTVQYIPSLCEYTGMSYNPIQSKFLYFGSLKLNDFIDKLIYKHDAMKAGHAWQNVADYRGCIHFPYNISTMSTFEQYTANIPLFFPTKRYLLEMYLSKLPVLHQICWQQHQGNNAKSYSLIKGIFERDPNNFTDVNCVSYWLNLADFYEKNMHCIEYFDCKEELEEILNYSTERLLGISNRMRIHNEKRRDYVYGQWSYILDNILCR